MTWCWSALSRWRPWRQSAALTRTKEVHTPRTSSGCHDQNCATFNSSLAPVGQPPAAPWAVLAVVLTRVVAGTSHLITIPPLIGGEVSLNIYIALVGKSGSGKDTAMAAGADAIRLNGVPFDEVTPGSGEGIAHAFMRHCKPHMAVDEHGRSRETTVEQYNTNALFIAAEIDSLAAMKNRNSSTIMPELRRASSVDGGPARIPVRRSGKANADAETLLSALSDGRCPAGQGRAFAGRRCRWYPPAVHLGTGH